MMKAHAQTADERICTCGETALPQGDEILCPMCWVTQATVELRTYHEYHRGRGTIFPGTVLDVVLKLATNLIRAQSHEDAMREEIEMAMGESSK